MRNGEDEVGLVAARGLADGGDEDIGSAPAICRPRNNPLGPLKVQTYRCITRLTVISVYPPWSIRRDAAAADFGHLRSYHREC